MRTRVRIAVHGVGRSMTNTASMTGAGRRAVARRQRCLKFHAPQNYPHLYHPSLCITLSYMSTITIRLDKSLERLLARVSRQSGRNRSDVVREALRRQLAIQAFEELRKRAAPFAEAAGYLTDEDVFRDVS